MIIVTINVVVVDIVITIIIIIISIITLGGPWSAPPRGCPRTPSEQANIVIRHQYRVSCAKIIHIVNIINSHTVRHISCCSNLT